MPVQTDIAGLPVIKVLLVEDNTADAHLLRLLLNEILSIRYELKHVARLKEAIEVLDRETFDVLLADLTLPDSYGFDTFKTLHAHSSALPILVLSGVDDETLAVRAVREGAQDYLVKGRVDAQALSRAITYAIERDRIETALEESEKHYRYLLESITDYTYTVKLLDGKPVQSIHSPACVSVTGYTAEDYEQNPDLWIKMVPEADRPAVLSQVDVALAGRTPDPVEHRILHKNGQVRWVRNSIVPSLDTQGRLIAYDGLIADITERKRAEEKLVNSEAFYHSLVENLPQFILRKDVTERFTFANQRFCNILGKSLKEIIGKTDFDFYPPDLASKYQRDDRFVIETGKTFETIEENVSPNGETIYVNVVKTPIFDGKGKIIGIQGIFWDITERKRWEERLQRANEELARSEAALRKSHEELKAAQLQLIQAEKMESVATLAAGVAHEVKNPLAILMMGVNFLNRRVGNDESSVTVLKEMQEAINRADSITRGLLEFSSSRQLAVKPRDLNELIEATLQLVRHEITANEINLTKDFAPNLPPVAVDKNQIQQVFVNVFMNAIQAMPKGGSLKLRTYPKQMTESTFSEGSRKAANFWVGDTVAVAEVEDSGSGIPQENLAKIFDPFFTTKPTGVGTGLGLPVSKKIIELHGGSLDIRNVPGGGVRAIIMLKGHKPQTTK